MHIILENKSNKTLLINLNGQEITLRPFDKNFYAIESSRVSLNLTTDDKHSSEKYAEKVGYYCFNKFITISQYDFNVKNDFKLELYVETKKGDHFEAYQRVSPYCKDFTLPEPIYTLKDEAQVKENFKANEKLENKAEKRATVLSAIISMDTAVSDVLMVIVSLALAVLIFLGISQYFSLKTAMITYVILGITGYVTYKILKKFLDGVGKTAEKFFGSKAFNKAVDKANEKFEENYVYCKGMPEELFKDRSSFLDPNYISAVFKYSNKNI